MTSLSIEQGAPAKRLLAVMRGIGGVRVLIVIAVAASFASRLAVRVGPYNVRPEFVTDAAVFAVALPALLRGRRPVSWAVPLTLACFASVGALSSLLYSPDLHASLSIVMWLLLDSALLFGLCCFPEQGGWVILSGSVLALVVAAVAIVLWVLSAAGIAHQGVQPDPVYGGYASYVLSFEANVLAAQLCLWGLVVLFARGLPRWVRRVGSLLFPLALVATHTRAAILAYVLGVAVALVARRGASRLSMSWQPLAGLAAAVLIVVGAALLHLPGTGSLDRKLTLLVSLGSGTGGQRVTTGREAFHDLHGIHWLVGLGTNSFGQRHMDPTVSFPRPGYLASLPLQVLYDTGLVGVGIVSALVVLVWQRARRAGAAVLGLAMVLAFLVISLATSPFWFAFTWLFVFLAMPARRSAGEQAACPG